MAKPSNVPSTAPSMSGFGERPAWLPEQDIQIPKDDSFGPQVKLIQGLSPEIDPTGEKYIKEAKPGDIVVVDGTGSPTLITNFGSTMEAVVLSVVRSWSEFVPRKQGGGFVARYETEEDMKAGYTPGNEVAMSFDVTILPLELGTPATIRFNTPTKYKPARALAAALEKFKTVSGVVFGFRAVSEKNRQGQMYYNFGVTPLRWTSEDTLKLVADQMPLLAAPDKQDGPDM